MTITLQNFSVATKSNPKKNLLSEINCRLEISKSYLVRGESGSGKTLFARSISGLLSYQLETHGKKLLTGITENEILYAPQFANLFFSENSSIEITKTLFKSSSHLESENYENQFIYFLGKTGLTDLYPNLKIPISTLSMGMKYRLMLIFLFLQKPKFLIVDEPTASLDVITAQNIIQLLFDYKSHHKCGLVVVSHESHYFKQFETELLKMENGYLTNGK